MNVSTIIESYGFSYYDNLISIKLSSALREIPSNLFNNLEKWIKKNCYFYFCCQSKDKYIPVTRNEYFKSNHKGKIISYIYKNNNNNNSYKNLISSLNDSLIVDNIKYLPNINSIINNNIIIINPYKNHGFSLLPFNHFKNDIIIFRKFM